MASPGWEPDPGRLPLWVSVPTFAVLLAGGVWFALLPKGDARVTIASILLLAMVVTVLAFGLLNSFGSIDMKGVTFGGAAAALLRFLVVLLRANNSGPVDVTGVVYVDGSPPDHATVTLLGVPPTDNRRHLERSDNGWFLFKAVEGIGEKVKFRVIVPAENIDQVVEYLFVPGKIIEIQLSTSRTAEGGEPSNT